MRNMTRNILSYYISNISHITQKTTYNIINSIKSCKFLNHQLILNHLLILILIFLDHSLFAKLFVWFEYNL